MSRNSFSPQRNVFSLSLALKKHFPRTNTFPTKLEACSGEPAFPTEIFSAAFSKYYS